MTTDKYAFYGEVIRLTRKDYNAWWERFCYWMAEPDYIRQLTMLDNWLAEKGADRNWFIITSHLLSKSEKEYREKIFAC